MGSRLEKNSTEVRKRIASHTFDGEDGEEYSASRFAGFSDYMRRKKIKLQNLDAQIRSDSDSPPIFKNVVVHVNGYTQPSLNDLHALIVSHGGGFQQYLDGKTTVTHIIATNLTPKKKVEFAKYRIVKPAWVVDSIAAGKMLPWERYRAVDEGVTQKVLGVTAGQMVSQQNRETSTYKDHSETSWYTAQVKKYADKVNGTAEDDKPAEYDEEHDHGDQELLDEDMVAAEAQIPTPVEPALETTDPYTVAQEDQPQTAAVPPDPVVAKPVQRQLTAEEHNAILLQNPHMAKSSTANPDFINQYYRESRLHHLSTWKAELKAQLQARAQESSSQRKTSKRPTGARRYVMHVDFDSFFAAVSLRNNAHLKDKPVVVAHGSGPGSEIASCNYPARNFGVKNGMWMKYALELCPDLKVLPYDYKAYEEASKHFYDSILAIDGTVQSISVDEALIDVTNLCAQAGAADGAGAEASICREQTKATELAQGLRDTIREKTGCEVSVGIGNNILLAKLALRKAKPAGHHLIKPEDVLDSIGDLTVTDLPGVAYSIGNKLQDVGIKFVKDIRSLTKEKLINTLGLKTGEKLWDYSRGIDKQEVGEQVLRKSVSAEVNWGIRFINQQQAEEFIFSLCEELSKRLLEQLVKGRQLTMKIMRKAADAGLDPPKNLGHGKCDTFNKSVVLGVATNDKMVIGREAVSILRSYAFPPGELRGLGVQMQRLEPLRPATSTSAAIESGQRRLQFKRPAVDAKTPDQPHPMSSMFAKDPSSHSPQQATNRPFSAPMKRLRDPIEDLLVLDIPPSLAAQNDLSLLEQAGHAPLNLGGTQFIIPSQIDPAVLAELPPEIRSKLAPKTSKLFATEVKNDLTAGDSRSRSQSPFVSDSEALPDEDQLDPDALAALPDDVREEVLVQYRNASHARPAHKTQQLLPQSPRKVRPIPSKKLSTTPKKIRKFSSLVGKARSKVNDQSLPTLTQANFVSVRKDDTTALAQALIATEDISDEFLEELPEDIRAEILVEQRRQRLQQKSGLDITARKQKKKKNYKLDSGDEEEPVLIMPKLKPEPTFTSRKLSTLPELRGAMSSWVQAFSGEDEEIPLEEDTAMLGTYLKRVVLEEGNMAKAQAVVDWLIYILDDWPFHDAAIKGVWEQTVASLKQEVQGAVQERGVAPLRFSE